MQAGPLWRQKHESIITVICTVLTYLQLCRNTSPTGGLRDSSVTMQRETRSPLRYNTSRCILRTNLKLFTHKPWLQLASVRVITEIWWMYIGRLPINNAKNNKFSALFIREGDIILDCYFPGVVLRLSVLLCVSAPLLYHPYKFKLLCIQTTPIP